MNRAALIASALIVSACAGDYAHLTDFTPRDDGFAYRAKFTLFQPEADPEAEKVRLGWLADHLRRNNTCGGGYEVTSRKVVVTGEDFAGQVGYIDYRGVCT